MSAERWMWAAAAAIALTLERRATQIVQLHRVSLTIPA
jgi:hypothetical protein